MNDEEMRMILKSLGEQNNEHHCTLYVKAMCDVLQRPVKLCGKGDIMFHAKRKGRMSELNSPVWI